MANMEHFVQRGEEVKEKWNEGVQKANEIGQEIGEVKEGLSDMPGGLDDDILEQIRAAKEQARQEARADMDSSVKSDILEKADSEAAGIEGDTKEKINENDRARARLQSIRGKYGSDAISSVDSSLERNTQQGQELISDLDRSGQAARANIDKIQSDI